MGRYPWSRPPPPRRNQLVRPQGLKVLETAVTLALEEDPEQGVEVLPDLVTHRQGPGVPALGAHPQNQGLVHWGQLGYGPSLEVQAVVGHGIGLVLHGHRPQAWALGVAL